MQDNHPLDNSPLRVFCVEDNPLITCHLEMMIEDLGHVFAGSAESFADLQDQADPTAIDCALVDIDLSDGPTGPEAAAWLGAIGIPSAFVTGQEAVAARFSEAVVCIIGKPVTEACLAEGLATLARALGDTGTQRHGGSSPQPG